MGADLDGRSGQNQGPGEFYSAMVPGATIILSNGTSTSVWSEHVHAEPATHTEATFTGYPLEGVPALTRRSVGTGSAWSLVTLPDATGIEALTGTQKTVPRTDHE
ncbi:hypothetical protein J2T10_000149 [Paenarthrobacter nicotinovorans]|uniref:Uncharacterized protein n=1 Tax=Paenarthrobacter nicotinovorans TaxID=29320 RepID=A0ABT9TGH6_PAENI|nr:hypothetical protein [Paenarthrobacter nicotinovorans]MDQ0100530.1 hypothetical protein [Paenarthrobacter nicotinovorans]GAT85423.1 beta-galactosidase [Paenarthrobacter nicotinovorans]